MRRIGLGIDIGKKRCHVCIKGYNILDRFSISNDNNGISILLSRLNKYRGYKIKGVIESTGNLWINIYDRLSKEIDISLVNPYKIRAIAEAKIKTDKIDAEILADLARADMIVKSYVPDKKGRDIRAMVRYRIDLVRRSTQIKNKIHNILDKYNLRYDGVLFTDKGLEWLKEQDIDRIDRRLIDSYLKEISIINNLIDDTNRELANIAIDDDKVRLLLGFTGIDYYGALLIIYEIGDINRFSNHKKLVSYVGLAPSTYQSGNISYNGRITKRGNKILRWYIIEAAHHASRYDPHLKEFYERLAKRRGNKKAIVAVARKMLVSIYYVLKRDE